MRKVIGTVIGAVDIGGTKVAVTLADADGLIAKVTQPTVKTGSEDALGLQVLALLDEACKKVQVDATALAAVGVSSCGPFVLSNGKICLSAPNICGGLATRGDLPNDWTMLPLQQPLEQRFAQVVIRNDCVAALHGERMFGAVVDEPDSVYVTWSTGVGFGLCVDGHLLMGKQGNAGHAGHLLMEPEGQTRCGCGNLGDLESLISGMNISRGLPLDTPALFAAAKAGEPAALASVHTAAVWLGRALYDLVVTLDTRVFMIGGSVWQHHGDWLAPIVKKEIDIRFPALTQGVSIIEPALGALVADVGALSLVIPAEWVQDWRVRRPWLQTSYLPN
ncbi:MAG: ROK family protein [Pseudomonadota bacterium]